MKGIITNNEPPNSAEQAVIDIVCEKSKLTYQQIKSIHRYRGYTMTRSILGFILRMGVGCTLQRVGNLIGRDHSTVIHYIKTHEGNVRFYRPYRELSKAIHLSYLDNTDTIKVNTINEKIKEHEKILTQLKNKKNLLTKSI